MSCLFGDTEDLFPIRFTPLVLEIWDFVHKKTGLKGDSKEASMLNQYYYYIFKIFRKKSFICNLKQYSAFCLLIALIENRSVLTFHIKLATMFETCD